MEIFGSWTHKGEAAVWLWRATAGSCRGSRRSPPVPRISHQHQQRRCRLLCGSLTPSLLPSRPFHAALAYVAVTDLLKATPEEAIMRRDIYDRAPIFKWADGAFRQGPPPAAALRC